MTAAMAIAVINPTSKMSLQFPVLLSISACPAFVQAARGWTNMLLEAAPGMKATCLAWLFQQQEATGAETTWQNLSKQSHVHNPLAHSASHWI